MLLALRSGPEADPSVATGENPTNGRNVSLRDGTIRSRSAEQSMARPTSLADKIAGWLEKLLGQAVRPAPVLVPVPVRRPQPTRGPLVRR